MEEDCADKKRSVEHQDIDIVACNDPFIEPHYAVSSAESRLHEHWKLNTRRER